MLSLDLDIILDVIANDVEFIYIILGRVLK